MMQSAVLVLTHGTSDLQILLKDNTGRTWRAMPDKNVVRRFHAWLLERADEVEVVPLGHFANREHEVSFTDFADETFALWTDQDAPDAQLLRSPEGKLQVVLPKIQPSVDRWLAGRQQDGGEPEPSSPLALALKKANIVPCPLRRVLVFSTDRGEQTQEPIATFTFLQRWFKTKRVEDVQECVFLHPGEKLEGGDGPISPRIAERIEASMRDFWQGGGTSSLLITAAIGGMPQIKPLLKEFALLLAGDWARDLFKTEHDEAGLIEYDPIAAVRTRRQCLQLVRRGALVEAYAMALPFHGDPDARPWVRPLEHAAQLLNGNPVGEPSDLSALRRILKLAQQAQCLLVAIRVETALLNERWLEAISGSIVFLEAALHDAINLWVKENQVEYEPRKRRMVFRNDPPQPLLAEGALKPWQGRLSGRNVYQFNTVGEKQLEAWDKVLGKASVYELRSVVYDKSQWTRLIDFRNYTTHGVMTQEEIDEAIIRFMGADLWSQQVNNPDPTKRPKPGKYFLGRKRVSDVVRELSGIEEAPEQLYQDLLLALESRLIDPNNDLIP